MYAAVLQRDVISAGGGVMGSNLRLATQEVRLVFTKLMGVGELKVYVGSHRAPDKKTATSIFGPDEVTSMILPKVSNTTLPSLALIV